MSLAQTVAAALNEGAFGGLEEAYLHRARREDSLGEIVGRDAVIADELRLATLAETVTAKVEAFTPSVLRVTFTVGERTLRQHRWIEHEGDRILRETIIADSTALVDDLEIAAASHGMASPVQPPLGELRSGRGQFDGGAKSWFEGEPQALLDGLHRIWNGRRFNEIASLYLADAEWSGPDGLAGGPDEARNWAMRLVTRLPDATLLFARVERDGEQVAILWRLFGHDGGVRARLFGSSLLTLDGERIACDDTLLDTLALEATRFRPLQAIIR